MFDKVDWYLRRDPWRQDLATDQQYKLLESLGSNARPKTKGEASDAIARLSRPDDHEVRFLQRFGIEATRLSQYDAMDAIARIILDENHRVKWHTTKPLRRRDVKRGDRVLLLNEDTSSWLGEITAATGTLLKIRPIKADGTLDEPLAVHPSQLLAREGQRPVKHAGNLIPGDLIYTSQHRSGLQYGKIVRGSRHDKITCVRWLEAKGEWTKTPSEVHAWNDIEVLGHDSDDGAVRAFFARIEKDRAMWQASAGRSGMVRAEGDPNTYVWQQKQRVWNGNATEPVQRSSVFVEPSPPTHVEPARVSFFSRLLRRFLQN